jgi:hypothetical protein
LPFSAGIHDISTASTQILPERFKMNSSLCTQWYDGLDVRSGSVMNVPMPFVPPNARTVAVGGGVTPSIDFHIGVPTDVAADLSAQRPARYVLEQNYPNPFNPSTTIRYGIPQRSRVILTVYITLGQLVAVLQNTEQDAGEYRVRV